MRLVIAVLVLLGGCGSPCQQVKATRCNAQIVELCGSNKKWQRVMDCAQVKPVSSSSTAPKDWICGETSAGHTCVPKGK